MKAVADCYGKGEVVEVAAGICLPEVELGGCANHAVKNEPNSLTKLLHFPLYKCK